MVSGSSDGAAAARAGTTPGTRPTRSQASQTDGIGSGSRPTQEAPRRPPRAQTASCRCVAGWHARAARARGQSRRCAGDPARRSRSETVQLRSVAHRAAVSGPTDPLRCPVKVIKVELGVQQRRLQVRRVYSAVAQVLFLLKTATGGWPRAQRGESEVRRVRGVRCKHTNFDLRQGL